MEPASPALEGGFFTTGTPGKSLQVLFIYMYVYFYKYEFYKFTQNIYNLYAHKNTRILLLLVTC